MANSMGNPPPNKTILILDDDEEILRAISDQLATENYTVHAFINPQSALLALAHTPFALIISDFHLGQVTGLEFLAKAEKIQPHASRVLITGLFEMDTLIDAINQGEIFRFLAKPWAKAELLATVSSGIQRHSTLQSNEFLRAETNRLNAELSKANQQLSAQVDTLTNQKTHLDQNHATLQENFNHSIELCYRIVSTFYPTIAVQTKAVVDICLKMIKFGGFSSTDEHILLTSAWLHDIGLVGIHRETLNKLFSHPQECNADDWATIHQHPIYSQSLAAFVDHLSPVGQVIRNHHEQFDGHGYPDRLAGESIPWLARCLAVAVAFVESGLPEAEALQLIAEKSGTAFDPDAVRLFYKSAETHDLPRQIHEVTIDELQPGMLLAKGIYSPSGMLLIAEGHKVTTTTLARILNYNLQAQVTQRLLVYS